MDQTSYQAFKKQALRQRLKYLGIILAIEAAVLGLFLIYSKTTGAKITDPDGFAWLLLLMLPFLFKLHRRVVEQSWEGEIREIRNPSDSERQSYLAKSDALAFLIKNRGEDYQVVTVQVKNGVKREIILVGDAYGLADTYYHLGDLVVKFGGLKFPINYTTERNEVFCPICGTFSVKGSRQCDICKHPLIDPERRPDLHVVRVKR